MPDQGIQSWRSLIRALVAERKRQKISLRQMAAKMGMTQHTQIYKWETEQHIPRLDNIHRYAKALGLNLKFSFERKDTDD